MTADADDPDVRPPVPAQPVSAPAAPLPVLHYEKPPEYRHASDLPPPGWLARAFWRTCYASGRLLGLIYQPRPAPPLYTRPRRP